MLPGADTHNQAATPIEREALYVRAATLLPDDADIEQVMRVAEWLHNGTVVLDPARVTRAARALARIDTNYHGHSRDFDKLAAYEQAEYEGRAAQVVTAYLAAR